MNRVVLGALAALMLVAAGTFWWQGRAAVEQGAPPPAPAPVDEGMPEDLPTADSSGLVGPAPPEAREASREERRFGRLDRDGDRLISRNEMLATRPAIFASWTLTATIC